MKYIEPNGQVKFERAIESGNIDGLGHFARNLGVPGNLEKLFNLSLETGPFIVKTHAPFTDIIRDFLLTHNILVTFIHRDPRDIILSAIDHGHRPVKNLSANSYFSQFLDVASSTPLVKIICQQYEGWLSFNKCNVYSYHELLTCPEQILRHTGELLGVSVGTDFISGVLKKYTENQGVGKRQYNTGKLLRFKDEMSEDDLETCTQNLKHEIEKFGYSIDQ